jgi:hypothetical protein
MLRRKHIMANQVQNKPTAAYILSLLGGIIGLLASLFVMFVWGILAWLTASAYDYGYYGYYASDFSGIFIAYTVFGIWMLITSILIIRYARKLNADPMQAGKYGKYIIVLSILGVGGLLGLVGGILALTYKPIPAGGAPQQYYAPPPQQAYQAPPPQQAHPCPQCGTMVQPGVRFCPNCGRQQY